MSFKNTVLALVEAVLWYAFAAYALYSVQNPVDIYRSALILVALGYLAAWACPLVRNSGAWKKTWNQQ